MSQEISAPSQPSRSMQNRPRHQYAKKKPFTSVKLTIFVFHAHLFCWEEGIERVESNKIENERERNRDWYVRKYESERGRDWLMRMALTFVEGDRIPPFPTVIMATNGERRIVSVRTATATPQDEDTVRICKKENWESARRGNFNAFFIQETNQRVNEGKRVSYEHFAAEVANNTTLKKRKRAIDKEGEGEGGSEERDTKKRLGIGKRTTKGKRWEGVKSACSERRSHFHFHLDTPRGEKLKSQQRKKKIENKEN